MLRMLRESPTLALAALVALVGLLFLLLSGVALATTVGILTVVVLQGLAGGYVWTHVRHGKPKAPELLGMGLALGTVASVISGLIILTLVNLTIGWVLPAVAVAIHWLIRGRHSGYSRERETDSRARADKGLLWGSGASVVLGTVSLIPNVRSYPLTWTGEWSGYHGDMLFFEALSTSMARLGPMDSIFSPDVLIRYHWLTYAWAGQVSEAVSAEPFVILTRVLPFIAVIASSLIAVAWARRLSSVAWAPAFAVILLITGGYVGATYGAIFNFDSPSQSLTTLWLLGFSLAVLSIVQARRTSVGDVGVLAVLSVGLAGGKISAGAVGVGAVLWLTAVGVVRRDPWHSRSMIVAATVLVSFALGYAAVVMGSADPGGLKVFSLLDRASSIQGMNPIPGPLGIALGTGILTIAVVARWSGLAWFVMQPTTRWAPDTVLGVGFALSAIVSVVALSGGMNDTWFALAASAPLAVMSAAGASEAWKSLGARRRLALIWFVGVALVLVGLVMELWLSGPSGGTVWVSSWRWLGPVVGVGGAVLLGALIGVVFGGKRVHAGLAGAVVLLALLAAPGRALGLGSGQMGVQPGLGAETFSPIQEFVDGIDAGFVRSWTDEHVAAATFLRDASSHEDLVATNITYSPLVPALSGLQTYVSGMAYQAPYGTVTNLPLLLQRERDSWTFIDTPSQVAFETMCTRDIEWLWIDPMRAQVRDWEPFARVVFKNASVLVLKVNREACQEAPI